MPKKKDNVFTFKELSKEAQERAVEDWVEADRNNFDSENLTDFFKELLEEKGFKKGMDVSWGLSYSQGDGVCFSGELDLNRFLDQVGFRTYREMLPFISVYVKTNSDSRYCHWNSMSVEAELEITRSEAFLSETLRNELDNIEYENNRLMRPYEEKAYYINVARMEPIRNWEERKRGVGKGVLDWLPDMEKPEPLDIPLPARPVLLPVPGNISKALVAAQKKLDRFNLKANALEEDVSEWVKDTSRELEKIGYSEIEHQSSFECVSETLEINEYEFAEDGERL